MPKFAANLSMLFTELPLLDRIQAAATTGFDAVECQFPYDHRPEEIASRLLESGMKMVLHNLPAGNWGAGDRGIAAIPGRQAEFRDGVGRAIEYARLLGCPRLNCLAGAVATEDHRNAFEVLIENLVFAADALGEAGLDLLIEPVNTHDVPGFFVTGSQQALTIMDTVAAPNLKLQYDLYHAQMMGEDLPQTLSAALSRIGHIQFADAPGRHEPGTGAIDYMFLFRYLDRLGYEGWIGAEYRPSTTTIEGLGWLELHRSGGCQI